MAIEKEWNSEEIDSTLQGITVTQYYNCLIADVEAGTDGELYLPLVGDALNYQPLGLPCICSHVSIRYHDNVNARVVCTFSSEVENDERERSNQVASWGEELSAQLEQVSGDTYYDHTANEVKNWKTVWVDDGGTEETLPQLTILKPSAVYTFTAYGDEINALRIFNNLGKINGSPLVAWFAEKQISYEEVKQGFRDAGKKSFTVIIEARKAFENGTIEVGDTNYWLFADGLMSRIRATTLRYDFIFQYNRDQWNRVRKGAATYTAINAYETFNPETLFAGLDNMEPEGEWADEDRT